MKIPDKFEELLSRNDGLNGKLLASLDMFERWLSDNRMVFFPGFTDHGVGHVEAVMRSAEGLITEKAWAYLTPEDGAVCLLAILLHDSAMHLSEDGFLMLIHNSSSWNPNSRFAEPLDWESEWNSFLVKVSRFDDRKLVDLFGKPEPVTSLPEDSSGWTKNHRLLIGEFLRWHHAALAHEIALAGVPGPVEKQRLMLAEFKPWMLDLAGFIARSHNMDLRECADRMPREGRRVWRNVHATYLMGILRIADYLEIQASRAPHERLQVRSLRSPVSRQEWKNHDAVLDVRSHENDIESLWIDAEPADVKTYLALQRLFKGIQNELDATWAVFGEVYGADSRLSNLGIRIRRVRSTFDDKKAFGKTVDFIPDHVKFRTADANLLKLLIGPLYDNDPNYGIRELMQNSIDACRELEDYLHHVGADSPDLAELDADVVVTLEEKGEEEFWLTVEDRGIGMTRDIILNYFLTAGASFRASEDWHELHADNEESRILRIGRFGVGLLAAFLIGSEIEVSTRRIGQERNRGIAFTCRLGDPQIELKWIERPVGTTIRIRVGEGIKELLSLSGFGYFDSSLFHWDWFTGERPEVLRRVLIKSSSYLPEADLIEGDFITAGLLTDLPQKHTLPNPKSDLPLEWRRLEHPDFYDVHWTWEGPGLVCNGIKISTPGINFWGNHYIYSAFESQVPGGISLKMPSLSIYDKHGKLPLNLTRNNIVQGWEKLFKPALLESVCRDFLAYLVVNTPDLDMHSDSFYAVIFRSFMEIPFDEDLINEVLLPLLHPCLSDDLGYNSRALDYLALMREGIVLSEPQIIKEASPEVVWFGRGTNILTKEFLESRNSRHILSSFEDNSYQLKIGDLPFHWTYEALYGTTPPQDGPEQDFIEYFLDEIGEWRVFEYDSRAIVISRNRWNEVVFEELSDFSLKELGANLILVWVGEDPADWLDLSYVSSLDQKWDDENDVLVIWKVAGSGGDDLPISPLGQMWLDILGQSVIPFDKKQRRKELASAYVELADEIKRWEKGCGTYEASRQEE